MVEGITAIVLAIGAIVITAYKMREAKRIVREMNAGRRCFHCDASTVSPRADGGLDCGSCGQITSAMLLSAKGPTEEELKALTKPEGFEVRE